MCRKDYRRSKQRVTTYWGQVFYPDIVKKNLIQKLNSEMPERLFMLVIFCFKFLWLPKGWEVTEETSF